MAIGISVSLISNDNNDQRIVFVGFGRPTIQPSHSSQPSKMPSLGPTYMIRPSLSLSASPSHSSCPTLRPSQSSVPSISNKPSLSSSPSGIPSDHPTTLRPSQSSVPSVSNKPSLSSSPSGISSDHPTSGPSMSSYPSTILSFQPSTTKTYFADHQELKSAVEKCFVQGCKFFERCTVVMEFRNEFLAPIGGHRHE